MEQTDTARPADGSIADIAARLALWGRRAPDGLARVEFDSEFSRLKVVEQLAALCAEANIPFHEIDIPQSTPAPEIVRFLKEQMAPLTHGVVSLAGWATAFPPDVPLLDSLRVLNYNRENLTQFPLCQIWWLTRPLAGEFIRSIPDLNSWFIVRLSLTENIADTKEAADRFAMPALSPEQQESARRQAADLVTRFNNAVNHGASAAELTLLASMAANRTAAGGSQAMARTTAVTFLEKIIQTHGLQTILNEKDMNASAIATAWVRILGGNSFVMQPHVAELANLYECTGNLLVAEAIYKQAVAAKQEDSEAIFYGDQFAFGHLTAFYTNHQRYTEAEEVCKQWLRVQEKREAENPLRLVLALSELAYIYSCESKYAEAEQSYLQLLRILTTDSAFNPALAETIVQQIESLYKTLGRFREADRIKLQRETMRDTHARQNSSVQHFSINVSAFPNA